jgi:hypothetical protein
MRKRTIRSTVGVAVLLLLAVLLSMAPAVGRIPPDIPKPSKCSDHEVEVCVGDWALVYACVDAMPNAGTPCKFGGGFAKVKLFPPPDGGQQR